MRLPKEELPRYLLYLLLGGMGFATAAFAKEASTPFLELFLPAISQASILWLAASSILLNLLLTWWIFSNQLQLWKRNYVENLEFGFYQHKRTKRKVCPLCYLDGVESPLFGVYDKLVCLRKGCGKRFENPDNKKS